MRCSGNHLLERPGLDLHQHCFSSLYIHLSMSLVTVLGLGALLLRHDVTALALPQVPPVVVNSGLGGGIGGGIQTNIGGAVGVPTIPSLNGVAITTGLPLGPGGAGVATGAQVGVPVPVVSLSTTTATVSQSSGPKVSSPSILAVTGGALLPPIPISAGPLSPVVNPIVEGSLNVPGLQNTDISALTTLVSVNVGAILPTAAGLPTSGLSIPTATSGTGLPIPSVPTSSGIIQTLSNTISALLQGVQAILQQQVSSLLSNATGSVPSISGVSTPALPLTLPAVATVLSAPSIPSVPSVPQAGLGAITTAIPGGLKVPVGGIPASSVLSVPNASALTADFPSLDPRAPQLGPVVGSLPTSVKVLTNTLVPVPASVPVGAASALSTGAIGSLSGPAAAISPAGLGGSLPTAGVPSIPASIAPSLPVGAVPSVPLGAATSLPVGMAPSLPAGVGPSLPIGAAPSLPTGVAPSLPTGVPLSLPTGVASGIPVPTGTALPNLPANVTSLVPPANFSAPIPTPPNVSLPGTGSVPAFTTLLSPNIPVSAPALSAPLPTGSLIPEGYGG